VTEERRRHPRVSTSIDARWQGPVTASLCKLASLSLGGCYVQTPSPPAVNEETFMTVFFGGRAAMPLQGRVVRAEPGAGFAMQVGEMGSEARYQLGQEIAHISRQATARRATAPRSSPRGLACR
jgi:hypothetical protein